MADRPTLHLTNAASRKPPHKGPEWPVWTIMAAPRPKFGECGTHGQLPILVPRLDWVRAAKAGAMPVEEYRGLYMARVREFDASGIVGGLAPGRLGTGLPGGLLVHSGETLICACSRAEAAAGRCHRVWAAELLHEAGWNVVLDGERFEVAGG